MGETIMGKLNPKQIKWLKEAKKRGENLPISYEERWHPDVQKKTDEDKVKRLAKDIVTDKPHTRDVQVKHYPWGEDLDEEKEAYKKKVIEETGSWDDIDEKEWNAEHGESTYIDTESGKDVRDIVRQVKRNREKDASRQKEYADEWADRADDSHEREVRNKRLDKLIKRAKKIEDEGGVVTPFTYNKKLREKRKKVREKVRKEEW